MKLPEFGLQSRIGGEPEKIHLQPGENSNPEEQGRLPEETGRLPEAPGRLSREILGEHVGISYLLIVSALQFMLNVLL